MTRQKILRLFSLISILGLANAIGIFPRARPYTIQPGDTLGGIAQAYGVSLECLKTLNPQIQNVNLIFPGGVINIPNSDGASQYQVRSGDSMAIIAAQFRITPPALVQANPQVTNTALIYPGQLLNIPGFCQN